MQNDELSKEIFPSSPDENGFFYENEDDKALSILTKSYDNGSVVKKIVLTTKAEVIVRKLKGRDFVETKKRIQNDKNLDFETVNMAEATTVDGKQQPPEFYLDDLYQTDYASILAAYSKLNF